MRFLDNFLLGAALGCAAWEIVLIAIAAGHLKAAMRMRMAAKVTVPLIPMWLGVGFMALWLLIHLMR